jgi:hypothetical protein
MRDEQSVPKTWAEKAAEILADCEEGQFSEPAVIGRQTRKVIAVLGRKLGDRPCRGSHR